MPFVPYEACLFSTLWTIMLEYISNFVQSLLKCLKSITVINFPKVCHLRLHVLVIYLKCFWYFLGHCAKQSVYSVMDCINYYIVHIEYVDVRQAELKSSVMEKIGCNNALLNLLKIIPFHEFVSDANSQIIKMLRKSN